MARSVPERGPVRNCRAGASSLRSVRLGGSPDACCARDTLVVVAAHTDANQSAKPVIGTLDDHGAIAARIGPDADI
jgi:hypothetical protein